VSRGSSDYNPETLRAGSDGAPPGTNGHAGTGGAPFRLTERIVARSVARTWDLAKREWDLAEVYFEQGGTCLCGHHPITERCVLNNRLNGRVAIVGNCCVRRFLGLPSEPLFAGLRRVMKNKEAALTSEVIEYAHERGWIDDWQRAFYLDTRERRWISPKQRAKRVEINERVVARMTASGQEVARCLR
jgi:hypothetical protein